MIRKALSGFYYVDTENGAFTSRARLSPQEVRELEEIIRRGGEGGDGHD